MTKQRYLTYQYKAHIKRRGREMSTRTTTANLEALSALDELSQQDAIEADEDLWLAIWDSQTADEQEDLPALACAPEPSFSVQDTWEEYGITPLRDSDPQPPSYLDSLDVVELSDVEWHRHTLG